jgi:ribosomal protein L35AE/L33A
MKPIKIGEDIHYKDPLSGQVLVGMVVSFDEETVIVWRDTRPRPIPRQNIVSLEDLTRGKP